MHSLHKGLRARGIDVQVLADISVVRREYQVFEGVPIWGVDFPIITANPFRPGNLKLAAKIAYISRFVRKRIGEFDLIQVATFRQPVLVGWWLKTKLNVPMVVTLMGSGAHGDFTFAEANWLMRLCLRPVIQRTEFVVALDEATRAEALVRGVPRDRVDVITTAPVFSAFPNPDETARLGKSGHLVYVGRICAMKRLDTLTASIERLAARQGAEKKLVIVGGGDLELLREEIKNRRIEPWTEVVGFDPHPEKYLGKASCFINPSESEGMPNAVLEACSWGVPVILSDIPAHRQIARAVGMENFLFPVGDSSLLSQKILELFGLPEEEFSALRKKCATFGQAFSVDDRDLRYISLYRNLVERHRK
jgi:glycosyltransferase involved in cell wall biosynthesis